MVVLWTPHVLATILDFRLYNNPTVGQFAFVATNIKIIHGFATAVLFFWKSPGARIAWYKLVTGKKQNKETAGDKGTGEEGDDDEDEDNDDAFVRYSDAGSNISEFRVTDSFSSSFLVRQHNPNMISNVITAGKLGGASGTTTRPNSVRANFASSIGGSAGAAAVVVGGNSVTNNHNPSDFGISNPMGLSGDAEAGNAEL